MKKIKFVSADSNQHNFAAAVRHNVHQYFKDNNISTKGNANMIIKTIVLLSFYVVPFVMVLIFPMNIWIAAALTVLMGIGIAGIGMSVMHDAVHGSYSKNRRVNNIMGGTMYLLGSNVFNWKVQHNLLHHAYSNIEGMDEDISPRGPIRMSEFSPLKKIHKYQHIHAFFFYGLMTLSKMTKDFSQLLKYNKAGITQSYKINPNVEYAKMILVKVIYFFAFIGLPIMLTTFHWWQVALGFILMHWVSGFILSTIFQMAHIVEGAEQVEPNEKGVIHDEWVVHEMKTTANFAPNNRLLNWYVGGLNFQIEHHLFPNICHIHYKNLSPIVEKTAREYGFNYNLKPTFRNAFASHVRRLKELGRK